MQTPNSKSLEELLFSFETASQSACNLSTETELVSNQEQIDSESSQLPEWNESSIEVSANVEERIDSLIEDTTQVIFSDGGDWQNQHSPLESEDAPTSSSDQPSQEVQSSTQLRAASSPADSVTSSAIHSADESTRTLEPTSLSSSKEQRGIHSPSNSELPDAHPLEQLKSSFAKLQTKEDSIVSYLKASVRTLSRFHRLGCFGVWGRQEGNNFSDYASAKGLVEEHDKQSLQEAVIRCLRVCHGKNKSFLFGPIQATRRQLHLVAIDIERVPCNDMAITFVFAVPDGVTSDLAVVQSELRTSVRLMLEHLPRLDAGDAPEVDGMATEQAEDASETVTSSTDQPIATSLASTDADAMNSGDTGATGAEQGPSSEPQNPSVPTSSAFANAAAAINSLRSLLYDFPIAAALVRVTRAGSVSSNAVDSKPSATPAILSPLDPHPQTETDPKAEDKAPNAELPETQLSEEQSPETQQSRPLAKFTRKLWWPKSLAAQIGLFIALPIASFLALGWMPYSSVSQCSLVPSEVREIVAPMEMQLLDVMVQAGDRVQAGQLLARFESPTLDEKRRELIGELEQASQTMRVSQAQQNDQAEAEAQIAISQLRNQLAEITNSLAACNLRAPIDGYVLESTLEASTVSQVASGMQLFKLVPLGAYQLQLSVSERQRSVLADNQSGIFTCTFPTWSELPYTVRSISPITDSGNNDEAYLVKATFDSAEQPLKLRPDAHGTARTHTGWQPVPWILFRGW